MGLTEEKIAHLTDDPLPEGVYEPREAAIVRFAQASARMDPITDAIHADLARHFSPAEMVQISFVVGMASIVNRFNAAFQTPADPSTTEGMAAAACPLPLAPHPAAG